MHRRGKPLCDLEGPRAGCSRDSASVQAGRERSRAKPVRSSLRVSPTAAHPQGCLHQKGESMRLLLKPRYWVTFRAEGFTQHGSDSDYTSNSSTLSAVGSVPSVT